MKHHRMILAAFVFSLLPAGCGRAAEDASAAEAASVANAEESVSFSASGLVADITSIGVSAGGRIALSDPDGLLQRLEDRHGRLLALTEADAGRSDYAFGMDFSTDGFEMQPCDDVTPLTVVARQGTEFTGSLCRMYSRHDDMSVLTHDQLVRAPLGGQTLHIHLVTSMAAERESLRDAGGEILFAMATDLLRELVLSAPGNSDETWVQWRDLFQVATESAGDLIRVDSLDFVGHALAAAAAVAQQEAGIQGADWDFSFAIDGAEALSNNGVYDFDRIGEIARPDTPAWCGREASYVVIDAAGIQRIWQQCRGTAPGESAETSSVRKFWIEDTVAGDYRWLELTATGSTDIPAELAALDAFSREALASIAGSITLFPAE